MRECVHECVCACHTPSTAFLHLPPNSARFSYATEGALFISAQLSTNAVKHKETIVHKRFQHTPIQPAEKQHAILKGYRKF